MEFAWIKVKVPAITSGVCGGWEGDGVGCGKKKHEGHDGPGSLT